MGDVHHDPAAVARAGPGEHPERQAGAHAEAERGLSLERTGVGDLAERRPAGLGDDLAPVLREVRGPVALYAGATTTASRRAPPRNGTGRPLASSVTAPTYATRKPFARPRMSKTSRSKHGCRPARTPVDGAVAVGAAVLTVEAQRIPQYGAAAAAVAVVAVAPAAVVASDVPTVAAARAAAASGMSSGLFMPSRRAAGRRGLPGVRSGRGRAHEGGGDRGRLRRHRRRACGCCGPASMGTSSSLSGPTTWAARGATTPTPAAPATCRPTSIRSPSPNPHWSTRSSGQHEIWAYLPRLAERFGLGPHLRLGPSCTPPSGTRPTGSGGSPDQRGAR